MLTYAGAGADGGAFGRGARDVRRRDREAAARHERGTSALLKKALVFCTQRKRCMHITENLLALLVLYEYTSTNTDATGGKILTQQAAT